MRITSSARIVAISAALAIAGSTVAIAQPGRGQERDRTERSERYRPSADDLAAFVDARIAGLKAGLRLSAEQEKNWPAFEEAYRAFAKLRTDRMLARGDGPRERPSDMAEALQRRSEAMSRQAAVYKQIADTTAPLFRSLDEAQQRRFAMLAPALRQGGEAKNFRRGHHHDLHRHGRNERFDQRGPGGEREYRGGDRPRLENRGQRGGTMDRTGFSQEMTIDSSVNEGRASPFSL